MVHRNRRGQDDITNEMLKNTGPKFVAELLKVFQGCQAALWTPPSWNFEVVKLLCKGGSHKCLDNYRGISLTSTIGKVFARILTARLTDEVKKRKLLPENQGGFRIGRSVEDNVFVLN